jgi:uncharacterized protein (TIGR03067 family)
MATRLVACVIAALFCVGVSYSDEPNKAVQEELKLLEGEWRIVTVEVDGVSADSKSIIKFAGGKCTLSEPGSGFPDIELVITLDPTKSPKWMDTTNPQKKTHKGIYELKGDKLKLAVLLQDMKGERPTEFKAKKGQVIYTYERIKPR